MRALWLAGLWFEGLGATSSSATKMKYLEKTPYSLVTWLLHIIRLNLFRQVFVDKSFSFFDSPKIIFRYSKAHIWTDHFLLSKAWRHATSLCTFLKCCTCFEVKTVPGSWNYSTFCEWQVSRHWQALECSGKSGIISIFNLVRKKYVKVFKKRWPTGTLPWAMMMYLTLIRMN